jgi:hypothetical protein
LHGRTEAIEKDNARLTAELDDNEEAAGEDWLMARDRELGRVFRPVNFY